MTEDTRSVIKVLGIDLPDNDIAWMLRQVPAKKFLGINGEATYEQVKDDVLEMLDRLEDCGIQELRDAIENPEEEEEGSGYDR